LGQSVIASLPEIEIGQILNAARTQSLAGGLPDDISETRARHFAIDDERNMQGLRCIASAIFDEYGSPIAALSIAGDLQQIEMGSMAAIGKQVQMSAAEVTQNIGGLVPTPDHAFSRLRS
jgi:IclR family acetate operon transcriptional repressor